MRNEEYKSVLIKYDEMQAKVRMIAELQRELNNFFSKKSEELYDEPCDKQWAENDTAINEGFVDNIANIQRLADKEINN